MPVSSTVATQTVQQGLSDIAIAQAVKSLPDAWLLLLPSRLTPDACLAVFQTCQAMRDLMLSQHRRVRTEFQLPLAKPAAAAARDALRRACQQCQSVALMCHGVGPLFSASTSSAQTLITGSMSSLGHPLFAVASVHLRFLCLKGLVPAWLRSACPNMTSLTLDACSYSSLPDPSTSIPACEQLQELCLKRPPQIDGNQFKTARWQHQLRSMTGLQRLSIEARASRQLAEWLECFSTIGIQLTSLSCRLPYEHSKLPLQLPEWFSNITELNVPMLHPDDRDMEMLLRMPSLKRLWFKQTRLEQSYTDRPCAWTDVYFSGIEVDQLARWPLGCKPSLHAKLYQADQRFAVVVDQGVRAIDSAVAAIAACGGIQWGTVEHIALRDVEQYGSSDACWDVYYLPIISGCHASHLTISSAVVTPALLAILQRHLASLSVSQIAFARCAWYHPGVCALLLSSLPDHVHTVRFHLDGGLTEADLKEVCVHALRAVTVRVLNAKWQAGWQQRVKAAMAAAGHEHVTLMY